MVRWAHKVHTGDLTQSIPDVPGLAPDTSRNVLPPRTKSQNHSVIVELGNHVGGELRRKTYGEEAAEPKRDRGRNAKRRIGAKADALAATALQRPLVIGGTADAPLERHVATGSRRLDRALSPEQMALLDEIVTPLRPYDRTKPLRGGKADGKRQA